MQMEASRRSGNGLSVVDGVAFMLGVVFGVGIFKTPSLVAANVAGELTFLAAWVAGGLITLAGALCYAELASAHPHRGGEYHFLSRAYGRPLAVLFAWARGMVIQTGAIAAVAFVYGEYAQALLPLGGRGADLHAGLVVIALTALNMAGTRRASLGQRIFTLLTIFAIAAVAVAGFLVEETVAAASLPTRTDPTAAFGMAMVLVLLTYGGWSEAAYLAGEMKDVARTITRTLIFGTLAVVVTYGLFNLALLNAFGLEGLRETQTPVPDLMRAVFGRAGEVALALVVATMAVSTLNATIATGARAFHALGEDVRPLAFLSRADLKVSPPVAALAIQGVLALVLILFGSLARDGFQTMVDFTAPIFWAFLLLVSLSLFLFRMREPERARPFRVPLYPFTPLLFSAGCGYLLYASLAYTGTGALAGLAMVAAGVPLLFFITRRPQVAPLTETPAE